MRVVLAEDNALLRAGLVELLTLAGFEVVGEASDADTLLQLVRDTRPHVARTMPRPAELAEAYRRVGNGGTAIDPQVIEHLLRRRRDDQRLSTLTPREREVLASLAEGRSNRSVAQELHVSEKTVEACTGRIFTKLDLDATPDSHRRVRAVLTYLRQTSS